MTQQLTLTRAQGATYFTCRSQKLQRSLPRNTGRSRLQTSGSNRQRGISFSLLPKPRKKIHVDAPGKATRRGRRALRRRTRQTIVARTQNLHVTSDEVHKHRRRLIHVRVKWLVSLPLSRCYVVSVVCCHDICEFRSLEHPLTTTSFVIHADAEPRISGHGSIIAPEGLWPTPS